MTTAEQQRLLFKLLPFDFTIVYKLGSENKGVDALFRRPQHADFFLVMPITLYFSDLAEAIEADPYTKQIRDQLSSDPSFHPDISLLANHCYYKSQLVIPDYPELKAKILAVT